MFWAPNGLELQCPWSCQAIFFYIHFYLTEILFSLVHSEKNDLRNVTINVNCPWLISQVVNNLIPTDHIQVPVCLGGDYHLWSEDYSNTNIILSDSKIYRNYEKLTPLCYDLHSFVSWHRWPRLYDSTSVQILQNYSVCMGLSCYPKIYKKYLLWKVNETYSAISSCCP